ncbi:MAG: carbohydrate kinase [Burkholderiales bacterium]
MFTIAGEALIDLFATADGNYRPAAGGAPYNFARALALQGETVSYVNSFSSDHFGVLLKHNLALSGARHLGKTSNKPTSLALVGADDRGQPRYSFYREGVADRDLDFTALINMLSHAKVFHTGALALVPPDHEAMIQAMEQCRERGVLCSVDVNMRPQVALSMGIDLAHYCDAALGVVDRAAIVKVSDEDLQHLGYGGEPLVGARMLLKRGCKMVVLTLGAQGAWALSHKDEIYRAAEQVGVVDTVGAGDCFYAGFIASLQRAGVLEQLQNRPPKTETLAAALTHGVTCAAINVGRQGCQPPTWDEAVAWHAGHSVAVAYS